MNFKIPRILIAGVHSGSGKTTVTLGLLYLLRQRGLDIRPFKVGPDFIDPGYHSQIIGIPSRNLDGWMLSKEYNLTTFMQNASSGDLAVIEGVMGLFDGISSDQEDGSSAQIAKWLDCPVILIVDSRHMARSVAPLIQGFERFDKQLSLAGVIFNQVGSQRHFEYLKEAVETYCQTEVLGFVPREESLVIPERHLGLVTSGENLLSQAFLDNFSSILAKNINIDRLVDIAKKSKELSFQSDSSRFETVLSASLLAMTQIRYCEENDKAILNKKGQGGALEEKSTTVAVARDDAFCFYYQDNLDFLQQTGARLSFFSPLCDQVLPNPCDILYLGGGYPELYGLQLSQNQGMINSIREFIEDGGKVFAECGGFIYLTRGIETHEQGYFPFIGIYPVKATMGKKVCLGYCQIHLIQDCLLGYAGSIIRGHEFHYSTIEEMPDYIERAYYSQDWKGDKRQAEGFLYKNCLAGYPHLHFGSLLTNQGKRQVSQTCSSTTFCNKD
ncbi:MAG: cobyrinate a,c-diamide synthase [bacterium]